MISSTEPEPIRSPSDDHVVSSVPTPMVPNTMSHEVNKSLQSVGHPFLEAKARRRKVRRQKERGEARQFVSGAKNASSDNQLEAVIKAKRDKKSQKNAVTVTNVYESEPGWTLIGTVHKCRHETHAMRITQFHCLRPASQ